MCTHLHKRGNTYYFRRAIPHDLLKVYGREEIQHTLGTRDRAEAVLRCRQMSVRYDLEFQAKRPGGDIPAAPVLAPVVAPGAAPQAVPASPKGISLNELADNWEAERRPDWKSKVMMRRVITNFEKLVGKLTAPAITREHTVAFKGALLADGKTSVNTNKYLVVLNVLLNYGVANGAVATNPARSIKVVVKRAAKDARHPFDLPALQAIFTHGAYGGEAIPGYVGHDAAYWIPLLALFYGARREELCQLRPEDVYEETYIDAQGQDAKCWVLRIMDAGEGQGVKTVASVR